MIKYLLLPLLLLVLCPAQARAQSLPQFTFPLACTLGTDCWITKYVDTDPAPGSAKDFTCGARTEDTHEGTDIAIRSYAELTKGVNILAARDGKILRIRDGEVDGPKTPEQFDTIKNDKKECGNGIVIDHGAGLQSFYCHLKNASITVKSGETVKSGQKIAQVGQSGLAEFPHLHFTVIWEGGHVDPFTGELKEKGCGQLRDNLWQPDIPYAPLALYDAGFTATLPDFKQIETGLYRPDGINAQATEKDTAFVFWIAYFGAKEGDEIAMTITAPDGTLYAERTETQAKTRTRQYYYVGKKRSEPLATGTYIGKAIIKRQGAPDQSIERTISVN